MKKLFLLIVLAIFFNPAIAIGEIVLDKDSSEDKKSFNLQDKQTIDSILPIRCANFTVISKDLLDNGFRAKWTGILVPGGPAPLTKQGGVYLIYTGITKENNSQYLLFFRPQIAPKIMCFISKGPKNFFIDSNNDKLSPTTQSN